MAKAQTLLEEIAALSESLADLDEIIGRRREEVKSFQSTGDETDGFVPLLLPADWDFNAATTELNAALQRRHVELARYRQLVADHETAVKAETDKRLAKLAKDHTEAARRVLQCEIELARAISQESAIRHEAAELTRRTIGPIEPFGMSGQQASILDTGNPNSVLAAHVKDALARGIVKPGDKMLEGVAV